MDSYLDYANAPVLKIAAFGIVVFVIVQSALFLAVALRRAKDSGISREKLIKAARSGVTTSIIPTLPIIMALIAIAPVIGLPISWMRLSVIGSAPYELMAAGIGAKTMGVDSLGGAGFTTTVFANSVWIMCIGSFWAIFIVAVLYKGLKKRYSLKSGGDTRWRELLINACFMGVFSIFIADPLTSGGSALYTFLISAGVMLLCLILIVRFKFEKLKEFALTLSMLTALGGAVLINLIGA